MKPTPTVSLLLTNLRLLDYNFDAFPITPDVFTSLTNKGKAFEHIIHHLFRTFDPDECVLKLQGCWPVYEPVQARELRNAVFRWLEDLKKAGRLGGVLIRRTALDDCCGQRYEELLLALSTMVLRDQIEQGVFPGYIPSPAYYQATSPQPSPHYLTTLTIAHRYALGTILEARRYAKAQWASFERLLDEKEKMIEAMAGMIAEDQIQEEQKQQQQQQQQQQRPQRQKGYEELIRRKWENNWLGDPRWLDIMLNGDPEPTRDRLLELSFEEAFENQQYFKDGRVGGAPTVSLKGLENQVAEQRRRVEEMRRLREQSLSGVGGVGGGGGGYGTSFPSKAGSPIKPASVKPTEKKGLKVEFTRHQNLHLKDMTGPPTRSRGGHQSEYADLLSSLREEMMLASAPSQRTHDKPEAPVFYSYDGPDQSMTGNSATPTKLNDGLEVYHLRINLEKGNSNSDPGSDDSGIQHDMSLLPDSHEAHNDYGDKMDLDDMDIDQDERKEEAQQQSQASICSPLPNRLDTEPYSPASTSAFGSFSSGDEDEDDALHLLTTPASQATPQMHQESALPTTRIIQPQQQPLPRNPRVRNSLGYEDELFAEQIVSTIAGASFSPEKPSPVKSRGVVMSGMMERKAIMLWENDISSSSPPPPPPPEGGEFADTTMSLPQPSFSLDEDDDDEVVVVEERHRQNNNSHSYSLAPSSSSPAEERLAASTPTEELLVSGDYNSVFKSRPKIALSPQFSPSPPGGGPVRGLNISMTGSEYEDDDEVMEYISSPLTSRVRR